MTGAIKKFGTCQANIIDVLLIKYEKLMKMEWYCCYGGSPFVDEIKFEFPIIEFPTYMLDNNAILALWGLK